MDNPAPGSSTIGSLARPLLLRASATSTSSPANLPFCLIIADRANEWAIVEWRDQSDRGRIKPPVLGDRSVAVALDTKIWRSASDSILSASRDPTQRQRQSDEHDAEEPGGDVTRGRGR